MSRAAPVAAVVAAAMLWGTTGTVQALLPETRDPLAVGALRLAVGAACLLALAALRGELRGAGLPWPALCVAGAAMAGYNLLFFHAVAASGVGVGTAITIGSAPVWASLAEAATGRMPGRARAAGQALSIAGVALLAGPGAGGGVAGVALALGAGACYALYSLVTARIGSALPVARVAAATFTFAAILTAPVLVILPPVWIDGAPALAAIAFLGAAATGLAYALYTWGLMRIAASSAVTLALAEPVTAWLLATFLVGEAVTARALVGAALVLAGLAVVSAIPARPAR